MPETYAARWRRECAAEAARSEGAFPPPCGECGATFGCDRGDAQCSLAIPIPTTQEVS